MWFIVEYINKNKHFHLIYRYMARIVIDGRELSTSTGRYVERLIHYLQKIDQTIFQSFNQAII